MKIAFALTFLPLAVAHVATAAEVFVPDIRIHPDDYSVLMAIDAKLPPGLKPFQARATEINSRRWRRC